MSSAFRHNGVWIAFYDGRANATENGEEYTGMAVGNSIDELVPLEYGPVATSPWGSGSLRYITVLPLGDGEYRFYFEASLPDGSHGLFTQRVVPLG